MRKEIKINIDTDIYEKFSLALNLSNDTEVDAIETCMRWYIAKTFEKASQEYNPRTASRQATEASKDFYGKAIQRIPVWALKPEQYNHKIIKAYFAAVDINGRATLSMMEQLCGDREHPELYVPTFRNNYSQMKLDGPKSHGKVFEDNGDEVWLWSDVENILMQHKSQFLNNL